MIENLDSLVPGMIISFQDHEYTLTGPQDRFSYQGWEATTKHDLRYVDKSTRDTWFEARTLREHCTVVGFDPKKLAPGTVLEDNDGHTFLCHHRWETHDAWWDSASENHTLPDLATKRAWTIKSLPKEDALPEKYELGQKVELFKHGRWHNAVIADIPNKETLDIALIDDLHHHYPESNNVRPRVETFKVGDEVIVIANQSRATVKAIEGDNYMVKFVGQDPIWYPRKASHLKRAS